MSVNTLDWESFGKAVIAQDDDNDYQESGWVAVRDGNWCGLARYSHCSCDGTLDALGGGGDKSIRDLGWNWTGTWLQLRRLARECGDPDMPGRKADPKDYDFDHLSAVYQQILALPGTAPSQPIPEPAREGEPT